MSRRLRVIAGEAGSLRLDGPPAGVRPTTGRTREVLFSSLGESVEGVAFVDLYAGSGSVGIEALSRGASRCLFVERSAGCVRTLRGNLERVGFADRAEVWQRDATAAVELLVGWLAGEAAVIFADPPYSDDRAVRAWASLIARTDLPAGARLVFEHSCRRALGHLPEPDWQRRVGETCLSRWERRERPDEG